MLRVGIRIRRRLKRKREIAVELMPQRPAHESGTLTRDGSRGAYWVESVLSSRDRSAALRFHMSSNERKAGEGMLALFCCSPLCC